MTAKSDAKKRRDQAQKDAVGMGEILGGAINEIGLGAVRLFKRKAGQATQDLAIATRAATFTPVGDRPTLYVNPNELWNTEIWDEAVGDAATVVAGTIEAELGAIGLAPKLTQPLADELLATHIAAIDAYGLEAKAHITTVLDKALAEGMSVDQAAKGLQTGAMKPRAAELVARTELNAASNGAANSVALLVAEEGDTKVWSSTPDERTRPDHAAADGQEVPLGQPFIVGGEEGEYPGSSDFTLNQRGNCRCTFYIATKKRPKQ